MKNSRRWIAGALLAATTALSTGCLVHMRASARATLVTESEPPPPKLMVRPRHRDGYVYVQGRWEWRANRWEWRDGHWQTHRAGMAWRDGVWERRGNHYHWVEGRWVAAASVGNGNGNGNDDDVKTRDHRDRR